MPLLTPRTRPIAFLLIALLTSAGSSLLSGQEKPLPAADKSKAEKLPINYVGVKGCVPCHRHGDDQPNGPPDVCNCLEAKIWLTRDKHQDAYNVLNIHDPDTTKNARAKRMAKALGANYDPQADRSCLSCHSTSGGNEVRTDSNAVGVTCVTCHGETGDWDDAHGGQKRDAWQLQTREKKQERGMTDLWNPAVRTHVCSSCHIGDRDKNRVVTHEMYAAGHPQLGSFEVTSYGERMTRHWQLLANKTAKAQKRLEYNKEELEQTKLVVVGAATTFHETMKLLAKEARDAAKRNDDLDFSQMDCAACHHDLRQPSWRQERGYVGRPGRPQFRSWPLVLLRLSLRLAAEMGDDTEKVKSQYTRELDEKVKKLRDAFDIRPYGHAEKVADAAEDLMRWSAALMERLNNKDKSACYNKDLALDLLRQLARVAAEQTPDYDTARQIACAFRIIYQELKELEIAKDDKSVRLFQGLKKNERAIDCHLACLDTELALGFPASEDGREPTDFPNFGDKDEEKKLREYAGNRQKSYDHFNRKVLGRTADYSPKKFKEEFAELAKLLP